MRDVRSLEAAPRIVELGDEVGGWYPGPVHVVRTEKIRATEALVGTYERVHAHIFVVPTSGSGWHLVDLEEFGLSEGIIAHVQPGQVMRWLPGQSFEADVVLIRPESVPSDLFIPWEARVRVELGATAETVTALIRELDRVQGLEPPNEALMTALAVALMHEIASAVTTEEAAGPPVSSERRQWLLAFRRELERSYPTTHDVHDYAAAVGISTRTLNRVTRDLVGQTAKELVDARLSLEARRRLVHTSESSEEIAFDLGFSEATNFSRFFRRLTGTTPQEFRESKQR
jgi:AraC-like DNA-binding protein